MSAFRWWMEHPWTVWGITLIPLIGLPIPIFLSTSIPDALVWVVGGAAVSSFVGWLISFIQGLRVTWRRSKGRAVLIVFAFLTLPIALSESNLGARLIGPRLGFYLDALEGLALAVSPVVVIGAVVTASIMRATQRRPGMRHAAVRGGVAAMIIVSVAIVGLVAWEAYKGEKDSREILANAQATADMQVFGGSIRAAFAAYAAESPGKRYPSEDLIRDYAMLRALLEPEGMRVPEPDRLTGFTVHSYQLLDADGDGVPESYQLVLSAVSPRILGKRSPSHTLVLTPESVSVVRGDAEGKTTR